MAINGPETQTRLTEQVAEEIRALLARRRMSGRELARRLEASPSWVNFRLTGAQPINLDDLQKIAAVLGVEVADLLPRPNEGRVVYAGGTGRQTTQPYPAQAKGTSPLGWPKRTSPRRVSPERPGLRRPKRISHPVA